MRPQLASSPAKAVLTSGLSAMVRAILRAEAIDLAPSTVDLDELGRPLAVLHQLLGQVEQHGLQLGPEIGQPPVRGVRDRRRLALPGGEQHQGVVGRAVAVHRDRVERPGGVAVEQIAQHLGRQFRVGGDEGEDRRHVRRDHARTLGDARDAHPLAVDLGFGVGALRERCRWWRSPPPRPSTHRRPAPASVSGISGVILASSSSTPITPVDASITSRRRQPTASAAASATRAAALSPALPVKELAQPALTTRRARVAARRLDVLLAPVHRRRADLVAREHPGAGRAFGEAHQQHVVALVLVETGAPDRDLHPGDRRDVGKRHGVGRDRHGTAHGLAPGRRLGNDSIFARWRRSSTRSLTRS